MRHFRFRDNDCLDAFSERSAAGRAAARAGDLPRLEAGRGASWDAGGAGGRMCHGPAAEGGAVAGARRMPSRDGRDDHAAGQRGERAGGGPARRSPSASLRLCTALAVTLSLSLPRGAGARAFFDGGKSLEIFRKEGSSGGLVAGKTCGAQTPPNRFVLPVTCEQTFANGASDTLSVACEAVSFSVITNQSTAKRPKDSNFVMTGDPAAYGIKIPATDCALPSTVDGGSSDAQQFNQGICHQNYRQKCGLDVSVQDYMLVDRDPARCPEPRCQDLEPIDSRQPGEADCVCGGSPQEGLTLGTCTCLHWQRYSLKPNQFMSVADSALCFSAVKAFDVTDSEIEEERCIYLDMTVKPFNLRVMETVDGVPGAAVTSVSATVGQPLTLTVFAEDLNTHQTLQIDLQKSITSEKPSVELPRQQWLTEGAHCATTLSLTDASMKSKCSAGSQSPRAMWRRSLTYIPLLSESGMTYPIRFQATDNGVSPALLEGSSENFQYFSNLGGTACGVSRPTLCSPASMVYKPDAASITVQVALALSCPLAVSV